MSTSVVLKSEGTDLSSQTFLGELLKQCEAKNAVSESINDLRQKAVSVATESTIPSKKMKNGALPIYRNSCKFSFKRQRRQR
ncbi:MAG: hypothetical protein HC784_17020 [Hydrococcus sp. CSU_1_8]|nr:hypothetical protein [Hydrococcus sp. CSU_1_8]